MNPMLEQIAYTENIYISIYMCILYKSNNNKYANNIDYRNNYNGTKLEINKKEFGKVINNWKLKDILLSNECIKFAKNFLKHLKINEHRNTIYQDR